jgi:hypothetical protein
MWEREYDDEKQSEDLKSLYYSHARSKIHTRFGIFGFPGSSHPKEETEPGF